MITSKLSNDDIEMVCEAYSEHYATYNREAMINMLCELLPTSQCEVSSTLVEIREMLRKTYNIF